MASDKQVGVHRGRIAGVTVRTVQPDEHDARTAHKYESLEPITQAPEYCVVCGTKIETMNFKGTGVCGEAHRKVQEEF